MTRVAQSARYRAAHSPACQLKRRFAPRQRRDRAVVTYLAERIRRRIFAGGEEVRRTQRSFHNAAGRAENNACAGAVAQRRIKRGFRDVFHIEVLGTRHARQLSGGDDQIDIAAVTGRIHARQLALGLFCDARHDGDAVNFVRVHAEIVRQPGLADRAEHLLRRLSGGQTAGHFRELRLQKAHPARAARGKHRLVVQIACLQALEQLGAFLHDGQIGGKRGVEHIIRA